MERSCQTVAASLALASYAIAMVVGLAAQNPVLLVLRRGLVVLVLGYLIGLVIGIIIEHVLREYVASYRASHAVPDLEALERAAVQDRDLIEVG